MTGLVTGIGAKLIFGSIFGGIGRAIKGAVAFVVANWKVVVPILLAITVVVYIAILKGDIRSRDKTIASQNVLIGQVKAEVDRGVGKPTQAGDAPVYIRAIVDARNILSAGLERQNAALRIAQQSSNEHVSAAHEAAKPTQAQGEREKVRQKIADPARTTGLTADEWSKL